MRTKSLSAVALAYLSMGAFGGTIYVDVSNTTAPFLGTPADPFTTITDALSLGSPVSGDTIVVAAGTYDGSLGESYPITIPNGVTIKAQDSTQANWPRVGGDAGSADAVMQILAESTNQIDTQIRQIYFLGEDTATVDAPPSILIRVDNGKSINRSGVLDCYFERSEMNGTGADNPTILVEFGQTNSTADHTIRIKECTIQASQRGAIEVTQIDAGSSLAVLDMHIEDCTLEVSGQDTADFGIRVGGGEPAAVSMVLEILDTHIDSTGVQTLGTDGILTGIDIRMNGADGKKFQISGSDSEIKNCEIEACRGDAIRISTESDLEDGSTTNGVLHIGQNYLHDNGLGPTSESVGAGVHVDYNDIGFFGYLQLLTGSNMISDNKYGYYTEDFDTDLGGQVGVVTNDTITGNSSYAFFYEGTLRSDGAPASTLENCLIWGNNTLGVGTGYQLGGSAGWDPCADTSLRYSNWEDLEVTTCTESTDGNLDEDPSLSAPGSGDYHLASTSSMIDAGDSFSRGLTRTDFEGDDREIDGDQDAGQSVIVDIGADEYDPP